MLLSGLENKIRLYKLYIYAETFFLQRFNKLLKNNVASVWIVFLSLT